MRCPYRHTRPYLRAHARAPQLRRGTRRRRARARARACARARASHPGGGGHAARAA
jgi:hypothetical protein